MTKNIIFSVLTILLVALGAYQLYSNKQEINEAATFKEERGNVPVKTILAELENHQQKMNFTGTFYPFKEVQFGAEMQGK